MLDTISDIKYKQFLKVFTDLHFKYRPVNSELDEKYNQEVVFNPIDSCLAMLMPLINVLPVLVSIGALRINFKIRHKLDNWRPLYEEVKLVFSEKFKQEKVNSLLRGLDQEI